jgi:hypothetical protein
MMQALQNVQLQSAVHSFAPALPDEPAPQHTHPALKHVAQPDPFEKQPETLRQNAWLAASAGDGAMIE